jgi:hypothetical protein
LGNWPEKSRTVTLIQLKGKGNKALRITMSAPHLLFLRPLHPFQWVAQNSMEELERKQKLLQKELRIKYVQYSWSDSNASFLEAVFARGDRRLGKVIKKSVGKGLYLRWMGGAFQVRNLDGSL